MNLIERVLADIKNMSADEVIQSLGEIYEEPVERSSLSAYPQFIRDIVFIIDLDTELAMNGIGGLLENSTAEYIPDMAAALKNIGADDEAGVLREIYEKYKTSPDDEAIDELSNNLYFYTDFDIWSLLEAYVEKEKRAL